MKTNSAKDIFAEMKQMVRGKDFATVSREARFERLQAGLRKVDKLALLEDLKMKDGRMIVQLKMVDVDAPDND